MVLFDTTENFGTYEDVTESNTMETAIDEEDIAEEGGQVTPCICCGKKFPSKNSAIVHMSKCNL